MNRIDELIKDLCPDGVEFKALGELGCFYGGITGKSRDDFKDGNATFITYKNVYSNPALDIHPLEKVRIHPGEKQRILEFGDIIFTGSSETPDECGLSSVVTEEPERPLYLNSFCFFFRFNDKSIMLPDFAKHLFRSGNLRYQIGKTASGVTRFNVSKKLMERVCVPVPPLEVQREIVRVLDHFTLLSAELSAELKDRKMQYEAYRDKLLFSSNFSDSEKYRLGDIAYYPKDRIDATELDENNYVGVDNLLQNKRGKTVSAAVPKDGKWINYNKNDILLGNIRPYLRKIWMADINGGTNGDVIVFRVYDNNVIHPRYLYHILASEDFFEYDNGRAKGAKMPRGDKAAILEYKVTIPCNIKEQEEIARILDSFDTLCNDIAEGLPAEIEARQKQYEYYRDKLLTFEEKRA